MLVTPYFPYCSLCLGPYGRPYPFSLIPCDHNVPFQLLMPRPTLAGYSLDGEDTGEVCV